MQDQEVKRERIEIPENFSISQIQRKYSLHRTAARQAKKKVSLLRTT